MEFDVTLSGNPASMVLVCSTEARWLCVPGFRQVCPCQIRFKEAASLTAAAKKNKCLLGCNVIVSHK